LSYWKKEPEWNRDAPHALRATVEEATMAKYWGLSAVLARATCRCFVVHRMLEIADP